MSDDESSEEPYLPRGVLTSTKGWKGEELELDHQRETFHKQRNNPDGTKTSAAVDLNQFRNFEVGKGYQARHVVRQQCGFAGDSSKVKIQDMTGSNKRSQKERQQDVHNNNSNNHNDDGDGDDDDEDNDNDDEKRVKKKRKRRYNTTDEGKRKRNNNHDKQNLFKYKVEKYISCKGLRQFRQEIETILNS